MTTVAEKTYKVDEHGFRYWPHKDGLWAPESDLVGGRLLYSEDGVVIAVVRFEAGENGLNLEDGTGFKAREIYYANGVVYPEPEYFNGLTLFDLANMWWREEDRLFPEWFLGDFDQIWRITVFADDDDTFGSCNILATSRDFVADDIPHLQENTVYVAHLDGVDMTIRSFDELAKLTEQPEGPEVKFFRNESDAIYASWEDFRDAGYNQAIEDISAFYRSSED